jgi:hypothetical protein
MVNILRAAVFCGWWTSAICGVSYRRLNDELSSDGNAGSVLLLNEQIKGIKLEV